MTPVLVPSSMFKNALKLGYIHPESLRMVAKNFILPEWPVIILLHYKALKLVRYTWLR